MKASRQPADPAFLVKEFLLAKLAARGSNATATIGLPAGWVSGEKPPAVAVFDDSGPGQWPVSTVSMVRVSVWADGRTRAREIAGWCAGWLYVGPVAGVAHVGPPGGLLEARDESNGGIIAGFTVRAKARTLPL